MVEVRGSNGAFYKVLGPRAGPIFVLLSLPFSSGSRREAGLGPSSREPRPEFRAR